MFLIFLLTCLFLSRLLIKYEIDIHVRYNLQYNFFLSELPISTFYGKQFYQKQVRKRNTIHNQSLNYSTYLWKKLMDTSSSVLWSAKQKTYHLLRFHKFQRIFMISVSVLHIKNVSICCRHKYNQSISRISEHICGRKWWLSVRQYRDQQHQRFIRFPFPFWISKICQSVAGISITSQFLEFQNISLEESDGCQYDSIVISDTKNVSLDRSARLCGLYHQQDPTSLQKR